MFFSEVVEIHGVKTETNAYHRISTSEKKKTELSSCNLLQSIILPGCD